MFIVQIRIMEKSIYVQAICEQWPSTQSCFAK